MLNHSLIKTLDLSKPYVWLATWGGSGLIKVAPGTCGTLAGLPFCLLALLYGGVSGLILFTISVSVLGFYVTRQFESETGTHDAGAIVIDEVAGLALAFIGVSILTPVTVILTVIFFRLFDILKPWPVSYCDNKNGALGVMSDDLAAGIYTALAMGVFHYADQLFG